ncbi:MAG: ATP-binding protein [Lachnospiraceae bacterium]|nr:ATP-binding protein [Lachnospiraceae bacterium]
MYSKVYSGTWEGIEGILIQVETDISNGLPVFDMIGYLSSEVKEAKERVRTALKNQGFLLPPRRITVNLAPAHMRKSGTMYDVAIAVSVLIAGRYLEELQQPILFIGEVGLDGSINGVQGVLPVILKAKEEDLSICFVPKENQKEADLVKDICCIGVSTLDEIVSILNRWSKEDNYYEMIDYFREKRNEESDCFDFEKTHMQGTRSRKNKESEQHLDFADIRGQKLVKRALEIAVSGHHNILLSGSPGSGKSALAKRVPSIMPELTYEEQLEITKIYSVSGKLTDTGTLITKRPYRAPHHSISMAALIGGGRNAEPGEISLAHKSVLFLDELPEFKRDILDMMRQPLEDRQVTVARNKRVHTYPADFMLVAAMNPCPCGYFPNRQKCSCTDRMRKKYQDRLSGPLLDRIDMLVSVMPVSMKMIRADSKEEGSYVIQKRVERTRAIQRRRYEEESFCVNAHLNEQGIEKYCRLDEKEKDWLEQLIDKNEMSYRSYVRILKLARTIADMEESEQIKERHLIEAVMLRMGLQEE